MNYKQIAAKLNLTDPESRETILVVLKEETRKGIFIEPQKGKFQLKELKTIITGKVSMTSDGSAFIIPDDEFEEDIYIAPRKVGTALNGDKVRAYVFTNRKGKRKEGEIIEILERFKMEFTGIVKISGAFAFFIPDDRKMLRDIFIPLENLNGAEHGVKAVAKIIDWPDGAKNPVGTITTVLGVQGENNDCYPGRVWLPAFIS